MTYSIIVDDSKVTKSNLTYEEKINKMNELYPNLINHFINNSDDYDILNVEIMNSNRAIVKYEYNCICCGFSEKYEEFEIVRDHNITMNDFYTECEKQWRYGDEMCNHRFLEILRINNNEITLEFGS